ncbi:hypothetical protein Hypma_013819 [Hypsizygus marmoreus]|uniref:DUF6534 domain-containing protein n=1 Tax=Hypsizygus marmoreus TaxID=39966 RepID=A0A369KDW9_HYPMA|nr:hypothetical protein Hypma_013819 [Hypsizygus marmoreus]
MATYTKIDLDDSMGSMLIGVIISAVLFGVSLVQTFYYYLSYPKDVWYLKALVVSTVVFDTVHLGLISHTVYHYLVSHYFHPDHLLLLTSSVLLEALFTGLTGAFVQTFYTARVLRLSKGNYYLSGFIFFLVVANAGCGTAWVILSMQMKTFQDLLGISALTLTINALSTAIDVMIAVTLCIMLNNARTGFKKSDTIINRLILFVVNTGVLTSCCAVGSLVSLLASPNTLIYASFYFCIGRFYTNSLLATLNARKSLTGTMQDVSHMLVSLPPSITPSGSMGAVNTLGERPKGQGNITIRIDTTKESIHEERMVGMHEISRSDDDLSRKNPSF